VSGRQSDFRAIHHVARLMYADCCTGDSYRDSMVLIQHCCMTHWVMEAPTGFTPKTTIQRW